MGPEGAHIWAPKGAPKGPKGGPKGPFGGPLGPQKACKWP